MSRPILPVDAIQLATDLPRILTAGKHALIAQHVLDAILPEIQVTPDNNLKLDLLWLLVTILQNDRMDYGLGGGHTPQEVRPLFPILKASFAKDHPVWSYITLPTGEQLHATIEDAPEDPADDDLRWSAI